MSYLPDDVIDIILYEVEPEYNKSSELIKKDLQMKDIKTLRRFKEDKDEFYHTFELEETYKALEEVGYVFNLDFLVLNNKEYYKYVRTNFKWKDITGLLKLASALPDTDDFLSKELIGKGHLLTSSNEEYFRNNNLTKSLEFFNNYLEERKK